MHHFDSIFQFDIMSFYQSLLHNLIFVHSVSPLRHYLMKNQYIFGQMHKFEKHDLIEFCTNQDVHLPLMSQNLSSCRVD